MAVVRNRRRRVVEPRSGLVGVPVTALRVGDLSAVGDAGGAGDAGGEMTAAGVRVGVLRPHDLVALDVLVTGMHVDPSADDGPALVHDDRAVEGQLTVTFPFQHLGEQTFRESDGEISPSTLSDHRAAWRSRLVFSVPVGTPIAFSSEGILVAMRRLPLLVVPAARARAVTGRRPRFADVLDPIVLPGGWVLGRHLNSDVLLAAPTSPAARTAGATAAGSLATTRASTGAHRVGKVLEGSTALRLARIRVGAGAAQYVGAMPDEGVPPWLAPWRPIRPRGPKVRAPRDDETAIEAPWRLILSPSAGGGFTHADTPMPADHDADHVELWHSRFGVRVLGDDGTLLRVDEGRSNAQRIVRAVWSRDRDVMGEPPPIASEDADPQPFLMPLSINDRWALVRQSAETVAGLHGPIAPEPIAVDELTLSALGTWLGAHGKWEPKPYTQLGLTNTVESWDHIAPMGRDQFVKVTYPGYLCSPGNKTSLVRQTERLIESATNPVARLRTKYYMEVGEQIVYFTDRDLPFASIKLVPTRTPSLMAPSLSNPPGDQSTWIWPTLLTGEPFQFLLEAIDHDGRVIRFHAPLLWVNAALVDPPSPNGAPIDVEYRNPVLQRHRIATDGQRIAYGRSVTPGDTTFETSKIHLRATVTSGSITPHLVAADVVNPTARALTPQTPGFVMRYRADYVSSGFADDPGDADPQLFGEVVDLAKADQLLADASPSTYPSIGFGSSEQSGGFVKPDQEMALLSRAKGTVGRLVAASGDPTKFDPAAFLGDALPRLFGLFDLADVLDAIGVDEMPEFVTETLGAVQGLLADVQSLADTINSAVADANQVIADAQAAQATAAGWATQTRTELEGVAAQLADDVDALTSALADLLDPTAPKDADAIAALFTPIRDAHAQIASAVDTIAFPPARKAPLQRLVRAVQPYVEDLDAIEDTVVQVLAFLEGLDPENLDLRARLDWSPKMKPWPDATHPIFSVRESEGGGLTISVEARAGAGTEPVVDVLAELRQFDLDLMAPASLMALRFERLAFRAGSSRKPEVDVVFGGIEFLGPLSFIDTLRELIPADGFSDPPFLDVSTEGVRAGFTLGLPNVAVGVFALQNISLGADCHVPFLGKHLTVGFNFCSRERPFALTVTFVGGGGFVGLRASPDGLDLLEMALEAGARLAIDLGIASGSVEIMVGVYLRLEGDGGSLTGYFRIRGEVDVLGLISASIEVSLELIYEFETGKMVGRATLTVEIEVFMFSFSVSTSVERRLAGSNGDPALAELMDVQPDATSTRWSEYCTSFAGEAT